MQIGHGKEKWPGALLKELIDNALDACEASDIPPRIEVDIGEDFFSVKDNSTGLLAETLAGSLDYFKRVSDFSYQGRARQFLKGSLRTPGEGENSKASERGSAGEH